MIPMENMKLIESIGAPQEHAEFIFTVMDAGRQYAKRKGYAPMPFRSVPQRQYFCAYKQGASPRGEGLAIFGFENKGEGLCLVFHHVVVDLKGLTIQTPTDVKNRWRRIRIDRLFSPDEIDSICKLACQCIDKAFA